MESAVKVIFILFVTQFILVSTGDDLQQGHPGVGCVYFGGASDGHGPMYPEDIDASICSHLLYFISTINKETGEIQIVSRQQESRSGGPGFIPRLRKLKEMNPDLKLILILQLNVMDWVLEPSNKKTFLRTGIKWLNESGFDGFLWPVVIDPAKRDKAADVICDMKPEFEKYGYMMPAAVMDHDFPDSAPGEEGTISKLARCCDYFSIILEPDRNNSKTHRTTPMSSIETHVEQFIEEGFPASKIKFNIDSFGLYVILEDSNETGLGANFCAPGLEEEELSGWSTIRYKELLKSLNDSCLAWTIRRDNETQEPYAFSTTGLWTSYEDSSSLEFKARYVIQRGLMGVNVHFIDLDDFEGIGGQGKFPVTRGIYNAFRRGNKSLDVDP